MDHSNGLFRYRGQYLPTRRDHEGDFPRVVGFGGQAGYVEAWRLEDGAYERMFGEQLRPGQEREVVVPVHVEPSTESAVIDQLAVMMYGSLE